MNELIIYLVDLRYGQSINYLLYDIDKRIIQGHDNDLCLIATLFKNMPFFNKFPAI